MSMGGSAVKKKCFSVEQIIGVLHQVNARTAVDDVCRQAGISEQTFFRRRRCLKQSIQIESRLVSYR